MTIKMVHLVLSVLIFYYCWLHFRYGGLPVVKERGFRYNYFVLAGYIGLLLFFIRTYNSYLLGYSRIRTLIMGQFISQLFSITIIYVGVTIGWNRIYSPKVFFPMLVCQGFLDVVWSYVATHFYFKFNPPRKTLLIYRNELDRRRFGSIKGKPSGRIYKVTEEFCYQGKSFDAIRDRLEGFEAIFVAGVDSRCRNGIAKYCKEENTPGCFLPHVGDVIMQEAVHIQSFDSPVLYVNRSHPRPEYLLVKRSFDFIMSLLGIIVLSPFMIATALAIKLYDGGPAIYKQVRLTRNGKEFEIYKFRSMRVDAEKDGVARLSTGDKDDRITPIGHFIRKFRLDEFPQLFNILKGDMSIVGPRPERPEIADQYYESIPDFKLRLQVKAGLTGYAQVYGKYNIDPYEKMEFDLLYINHMGVLMDLQLIFATLFTLFMSDATQGVEEGQTTAMGTEDHKEDRDTEEGEAE